MNGPDVARGARALSERGADLGHEVGEAAFRHEGIGPERTHEVGLGERAGAALHEQREQAEGLRGQVEGTPSAEERVGLGVEQVVPEVEAHEGTPGKFCGVREAFKGYRTHLE